MRVQHNIMAMNSYRNYSNNTSALSKNLEKLSSGYKINRAGDDAAGLAISEKMRAQITGLNAAQKNVKDGISLVKTAEGAMQEIQDMLNRMDYLATQSANGTYQDEVDREALQDEVNQLRAEINRIADSANFNGIKLLDGSLAGSGSAGGGGSAVDVAVDITGGAKKGLGDGSAAQQVTEVTFDDATMHGSGTSDALANGDKLNITIELTDGTKYSLDFEVSDASTASAVKLKYGGEDVTATVTGGGVTAEELAKVAKEVLNKDDGFAAKYTADESSGALSFTSQEEAFGDASIKVASVSINGNTPDNAAGSITTEGKGEFKTFTVGSAQVYDASSTTQKAEDSIYTVNGQKFAFAKDAASAKALGSDVNVVIGTTANIDNMIALMNQKLGTNFAKDGAGTAIEMISKGGIDSTSGSGSGNGLTLQIGDTADSYNQLVVSVGNMHTSALGIDGISIADRPSAQAAIATIKDAINNVSSVRGTLGAYQNRLEHTQNNLSVMAENIQDAESTIRDTDVAEEMMSYVKNNILVQSAQAMLAQANQVPQGVLQLLG